MKRKSMIDKKLDIINLKKKKRLDDMKKKRDTNEETLDFSLFSEETKEAHPNFFEKDITYSKIVDEILALKDERIVFLMLKELKNIWTRPLCKHIEDLDLRLMELMVCYLKKTEYVELILECFVNLSAKNGGIMGRLGVIENIIKALQSIENEMAIDLGLVVLANIATSSVNNRDIIIENQGLKLCSKGLKINKSQVNALFCLSNLSKGRPLISYALSVKVLKKAINYINTSDSEALVYVCEILFNCTSQVGFVLSPEFPLDKIFELTGIEKLGLLSLQILSNILMNSKGCESLFIEKGIFSRVLRFLKTGDLGAQSEALLLVINLCNEGDAGVHCLVRHPVLKYILELINSEFEDIRINAIILIDLAASHKGFQRYFLNSDYMRKLLKNFNENHPDLIVYSLSALNKLVVNEDIKKEFEISNGTDQLEELKRHPNQIIPLMIEEFFERHFSNRFSRNNALL